MTRASGQDRDPSRPGFGLPHVAKDLQLGAVPENPSRPELRTAPAYKRFAAWFIDFLVFFTLAYLLNWTLLKALAAYLLVVAIPLTALRGQTVGQMALGVAVVGTDGRRPPRPLRAALHVVLALVLVPFAAVLLFLLVILKESTGASSEAEAGGAALEAMPRRLLHDRLAGTVVIDATRPVTDRQWQAWCPVNKPPLTGHPPKHDHSAKSLAPGL